MLAVYPRPTLCRTDLVRALRLLRLVSAGRNEHGLPFERAAAVRHAWLHVRGALAVGGDGVEIRVSDLSADGRDEPIIDAVRTALGKEPRVRVVDDASRKHGRGYYSGYCFKLHVLCSDTTTEIGDGGFVDWSQQLPSDRQERLIATGTSVDRLALITT